MESRDLATAHAVGRVVLGSALALAPGLTARAWVGRPAAAPGTRVITTAMGSRDVAIGLGLADALRRGREPRPWLRAGMLGDVADLAATIAARGAIPRPATALVTSLAAGSIALGLYLHRELGKSPR